MIGGITKQQWCFLTPSFAFPSLPVCLNHVTHCYILVLPSSSLQIFMWFWSNFAYGKSAVAFHGPWKVALQNDTVMLLHAIFRVSSPPCLHQSCDSFIFLSFPPSSSLQTFRCRAWKVALHNDTMILLDTIFRISSPTCLPRPWDSLLYSHPSHLFATNIKVVLEQFYIWHNS